MRKLIIYLPESVMDYLQLCQYEYTGLQSLLKKVISDPIELSDEDNNFWKTAYLEAFNRLEFAKKFIQNEYLSPHVKAGRLMNWRADFNDNYIEMHIKEDA